MSKPALKTLAATAASILVLALAHPAGHGSPQLIRHVRIGAFAGPAYYSVVDGGFRAIQAPVTMAANADGASVQTATTIASQAN